MSVNYGEKIDLYHQQAKLKKGSEIVNKDEEYARSVWGKNVSASQFGRHVWMFGEFEPLADWSAAAEFTRERVEEVRQLREAHNKFRFMCSALAPEEWAAMEPVDKLATAELTRLTEGMKPEAL